MTFVLLSCLSEAYNEYKKVEDLAVTLAWKDYHIVLDRCTFCGLCAQICPQGVLQLEHGTVVIQAPENCADCGLCEEACPQGAIELEFFIVWDDAHPAS